MQKFSLQNYLFEKFQSSILQNKILNNPSHLLNYIQSTVQNTRTSKKLAAVYKIFKDIEWEVYYGDNVKYENENAILPPKTLEVYNKGIEELNRRIPKLFDNSNGSTIALTQYGGIDKYDFASIGNSDFSIVTNKDLKTFYNEKIANTKLADSCKKPSDMFKQFTCFYFNANNISEYGDRANWLIGISFHNSFCSLKNIEDILASNNLGDLSKFNIKPLSKPYLVKDAIDNLKRISKVVQLLIKEFNALIPLTSAASLFKKLNWGSHKDDYVIFYGINNAISDSQTSDNNAAFFKKRNLISAEEATKRYEWVDKKLNKIVPYDIKLDKFNSKFKKENLKRYKNKKDFIAIKKMLSSLSGYQLKLKQTIKALNEKMKQTVSEPNYQSEDKIQNIAHQCYEKITLGFQHISSIMQALKNADNLNVYNVHIECQRDKDLLYWIKCYLEDCQPLISSNLNESFKSKTLASIASIYNSQKARKNDYYSDRNFIIDEISKLSGNKKNANAKFNFNKNLKKHFSEHEMSLGDELSNSAGMKIQLDKIPEKDVVSIPIDKATHKEFKRYLLFWLIEVNGKKVLYMISKGNNVYYAASLQKIHQLNIPEEDIDTDKFYNDYQFKKEVLNKMLPTKEIFYYKKNSYLSIRSCISKVKNLITNVYGISEENLNAFQVPAEIIRKREEWKKELEIQKNMALHNAERYKSIIYNKKFVSSSDKAVQSLKNFQEHLFNLFNDLYDFINKSVDDDMFITALSKSIKNVYIPKIEFIECINESIKYVNNTLKVVLNKENYSFENTSTFKKTLNKSVSFLNDAVQDLLKQLYTSKYEQKEFSPDLNTVYNNTKNLFDEAIKNLNELI